MSFSNPLICNYCGGFYENVINYLNSHTYKNGVTVMLHLMAFEWFCLLLFLFILNKCMAETKGAFGTLNWSL